nr:MAG TPA: hypothetical protein [Crassvirales sp.]
MLLLKRLKLLKSNLKLNQKLNFKRILREEWLLFGDSF